MKALAIISPAFLRLSADEINLIDRLRVNQSTNQEKRLFLRHNNNLQQHCIVAWESLKKRAEDLDLDAAAEMRSYGGDFQIYWQHHFLKAKAELWEWIVPSTKEIFALLKPVAEKWQGYAEKILADYVASQSAARAMYAKTAALIGVESLTTVDRVAEKLENFIQLCRVLQTDPRPLKSELEFIDPLPLINGWLVEI